MSWINKDRNLSLNKFRALAWTTFRNLNFKYIAFFIRLLHYLS